jgi:DNA-binding HxlR family transcriptional regulator
LGPASCKVNSPGELPVGSGLLHDRAAGSIKAEFAIPLERPRQQSMMMSSEFLALRRGLMSLIREESIKAMGGEISDLGMQGLNIELHGHSPTCSEAADRRSTVPSHLTARRNPQGRGVSFPISIDYVKATLGELPHLPCSNQRSNTMAKSSLDHNCPVARTLDIVGERWTLLIVRDLLSGTKRFQDFQERLPGMAPNVLSARLKTLEAHGLVRRDFYSDHPPRASYTLTDQGRELGLVVLALGRWGIRNLSGKLNRNLYHEEAFRHLARAADALKRHPVQRGKATAKAAS